jgi:ABC-type transport system involved in Fe-S cluster assembly fused permease/ATPase subunit
MVTHDLEQIADADRIVVLSEGYIVEQGKHDELLQSKGEYATLLKATG